MKKLSIIIPVFNEGETIFQVLEILKNLVLNHQIEKELIIVNDCSSDQSGKEIDRFLNLYQNSNYKLIHHPVNKGKGAAIQTGIKEATGDYTIIQDADLELNPEEINLLIEPVMMKEANIVYGSRFLNENKQGGSKLSNLANLFLTRLSNFIFRIRITDMETCYKLVPTYLYKEIHLVEMRFGFEPEITAKLAKYRELKWKEIPISYRARSEEEGKKIGWKDGFRAIWCILKYGLQKKKKNYS